MPYITTKGGARSFLNLLSFVLLTVFIVSSMLLVVIGISAYKNTDAAGSEADSIRMSLGYITNKLKAEDRQDAISIKDYMGVKAIAIKHEYEEECETLIYFYNGNLMEMFKFADSDIAPEFGTKLCELNGFNADIDNGLVTVEAVFTNGETGHTYIALKCGESAYE